MKYILLVLLSAQLSMFCLSSQEWQTIALRIATKGSDDTDRDAAVQAWRNIDNDAQAAAANAVINAKWAGATAGKKRYPKMSDAEVKAEAKTLVTNTYKGLLNQSGVSCK